MVFINEDSCECTKSSLDLFSVPPTQTSIEASSFIDYYPISSLVDGSPIEFDISSSGEIYLDLNNSQLYCRVQIVKGDGTTLDANDKVGPVNNFLVSLFMC